MKTIQPFIKAGWNTVPLRGELRRLEDGSKTVPKFEKNWREKYQEETNAISSKLGGAMTGEVSGIIVIDCDNDVTFELFNSLNPEYEFIFMSKGKVGTAEDGSTIDKVCGSIVYEYDQEFADNFSINDGTLALDFYSNTGFVYLPTESNKTKYAWNGKFPKLATMPTAVRVLLDRLRQSNARPTVEHLPTANDNVMTANCLAPLVKQFITDRKFMPGLFKIITPKDFRNEPQYLKEGYLHPSQVPDGRGSEYLSKISAILGSDISIDEEVYMSAIHDINDLFGEPMNADRLDKTIADPMISGNANIDGKPIWQYDENWSNYRLILHTKRQSSIELGFDDRRNVYYCVDAANERMQLFARDAEFMSYIANVAVNPISKKEMNASIPIINVTSAPNHPFGFYADDDPTARTLNTFIRTPELTIMEDPESYRELYRRPDTVLKFLETLVPDDDMRTYLLQFIKRKLKTFEYSPIYLFFLGVQGSGKDTFVQLIEKIMGHVAKPTTKEFLEMFNGWLLDTYFVQLDEYGNQLTTFKDKDEALGKLKAYTGKQNVQIRKMRSDGFTYNHNATFICTANSNPFGIEDNDRRCALFETPNVLINQDWVDDIAKIHEKIMDESKDFCYYLATEVGDLSSKDYQLPPESPQKQTLIADSMYASRRIAYVLKNGMKDYLKNLAKDHGCQKVVDGISKGRITTLDMEDLYDEMTNFKGEMRSLNRDIRQAGIELKATTHEGEKRYYYNLPWLEEEFEPDE